MKKSTQRLLAFIFGVAFLVVLLVIAVVIEEPTQFQWFVFRNVLALAAAGVAAMIPGFIQVDIPRVLRAGGALAVFAVVYFFDPGQAAHSAFVPPEEALVSVAKGEMDAAELVGGLCAKTGSLALGPALARKLTGKRVVLTAPLEEVSLKVAMTVILGQLDIQPEFRKVGKTVMISERGAAP